MATLDHFTARPDLRFDLRAIAFSVTVLVLLGIGGVALTAPPAGTSDDWHGNVAASAPR